MVQRSYVRTTASGLAQLLTISTELQANVRTFFDFVAHSAADTVERNFIRQCVQYPRQDALVATRYSCELGLQSSSV